MPRAKRPTYKIDIGNLDWIVQVPGEDGRVHPRDVGFGPCAPGESTVTKGVVEMPMSLLTQTHPFPYLAVRVYGILRFYAGGEVGDVAAVNREMICHVSGRSIKPIGLALKALERHGYITNLSGSGEDAIYRIDR